MVMLLMRGIRSRGRAHLWDRSLFLRVISILLVSQLHLRNRKYDSLSRDGRRLWQAVKYNEAPVGINPLSLQQSMEPLPWIELSAKKDRWASDSEKDSPVARTKRKILRSWTRASGMVMKRGEERALILVSLPLHSHPSQFISSADLYA